MREIEFRAKHNDTGEWYFGCLLEGEDNIFIRDKVRDEEHGYLTHPVIPETVGQLWATINNNKYFEGDIFSVGLFTNVTYVIIYNDIKKCVSFIKISEYKKLKRGDELSRLNILYNLGSAKFELMQKDNPTLLGNIFDNPDLLK